MLVRLVILPCGHEFLRVRPRAAGLAIDLAERGHSQVGIMLTVEEAYHDPRGFTWFGVPEQR